MTTSPLICLHGWLGSPEDFDPLTDELRARDWRGPIAAIALPGHANAPAPRIADFDATVDEVAERIRSTAPDRCRLLGYSMGGRIALALTARRVLDVEQLTILGAHPGIDDTAERNRRLESDLRLASRVESLGDDDAIAAFLEDWYSQPLFRSLAAHPRFTEWRERRRGMDPVASAQALRALSTGRQPTLTESLIQRAPSIRAIAGALDTAYVERLGQFANRVPTAALSVVPDVGHATHLESPSTVADILAADLLSNRR